ncbi:MAG: uroporphyrinogen decarboxylase family protein [Armatimonadota bacterium]|nr:uroporphyrinogen decarboxylase family protein [Armatimonadota bacterium]
MTHRQRILGAIRGEPVDRVPWVPRLDLWYKANRTRGTLPAEWRDLSLPEIAADLGVGRHEVIPDFLDVEEPDQIADQSLGLVHVRNQPYRLRFRRTERIVERDTSPDGDTYRVTYRTPVGSVTTILHYTRQMRRDGVTLLHTSKRAIESLEDYEVIAFLFEDLEVDPGGRYDAFREEVGDEGVAVAFANVAGSPMHHLLKELVPYDQFYYDLHDHPDLMAETAVRMQGLLRDVVEACAASSAEVVMLGANYDVMLTPPPLFAEHVAPFLTEATARLHEAGKLVATHTDGENQGLLELYVQCGVDVADSVCPAPMTRLPLAEYRRVFGTRPAIWGGICSASVLPDSFTDEEFEAHVDAAVEAGGDMRGIIYSIADTTPPDASLDRIRRIGDRLAAVPCTG